jgi:3-methyladenine DNA glycosylase AlkC
MENNWSHFLQRNDKSISRNYFEFISLLEADKAIYVPKKIINKKQNKLKNLCTLEELEQNIQLCVANTEETPSGCITHET